MSTTETLTTNFEETRKDFLSWIVKPINDVEEGYTEGHFTKKWPYITNKTVPLKNVEGEKRVYVVGLPVMYELNEYVAELAKYGFKPCVDSPNYLLGLMKQVSESEMFELLGECDIVAAEPNNPSSVFLDEDNSSFFLSVHRWFWFDANSRKHERSLHRANAYQIKYSYEKVEWDYNWKFLAEEL